MCGKHRTRRSLARKGKVYRDNADSGGCRRFIQRIRWFQCRCLRIKNRYVGSKIQILKPRGRATPSKESSGSIPGLNSSFLIYPCEPTSYQRFATNMAGGCSNEILGALAGLEA